MAHALADASERTGERRESMINKAQITRRSAKEDVPAQTVERDYILAHIIAAVSDIQEESGWSSKVAPRSEYVTSMIIGIRPTWIFRC